MKNLVTKVMLIQDTDLVKEFREMLREEMGNVKPNPTSDLPPSKYIKIDEVARILEVTKPTIYNWVNQGLINKYKINSRTYFQKEEILNLFDDQQIK